MIAGMSSCRNVRRAASMLPRPASAASLTALIFCTPWLTPIAKIRNGTSSPRGSIPYPSSTSVPNCHTTAITEQATGTSATRNDWQ